MNDELKEELQELLVQLVTTALLAIGSVLTKALINKVKFGHISNVPSGRTYREPKHYRSESAFDEEEYYLNLGDDDDPEWYKP